MTVTGLAGRTAPATACQVDRQTGAVRPIEDNYPELADRLGVAQNAVLNVLEGFNEGRLRLCEAQRALINILRDAEGERIQLESTQRAILNILEDADLLARNLAEARDQAEDANRAKSRFLTGITHELRTPLHGLLGYAELLSLEGGLNPVQSERVAAMIAAGEHLLGTINAVLDMSQIEADKMELHPEEIELTELAQVCLDVIRPTAEAKGLSLGFTAAGSARLVADPTRLRQVLINLLGNAIKFTPSGSIEVRQQQAAAGGYIRLEVADTGPGIRAQHLDKLFRTFERLNANAVSGIEGTGLGLAISARLVRLMGGRIGYADNPGGGSLFWLELPANGNAAVANQPAAPLPVAAGAGLRVMVVDDEPLNRNIACGLLAHGGHDVVCIDNAPEAVKLAACEDFDVILMDVRMPGMNGLEATRLIRALPPPRGLVPVVAVTAQAFAEQIEICRLAGMATHVPKPFNRGTLLATVDLVGRKSTRTMPVPPSSVSPPGSTVPEPLVFDRDTFDDSTAVLSAEEVEFHLRTLIDRGEALRHRLHAPGMLTHASELAEAVHGLAGGASMLGFQALGFAGRRFEAAAGAGAAETDALAGELVVAIVTAITFVRRHLGGTTMNME